MADRYFVDEPIAGSTARLTGAEAHHLAHVMRARPGHRVILFDGSGREFTATVIAVHRAEIELAIDARHGVDRELPLDITLAVALPKGDRQRWLVEKATELGVRRILPLITERGNERPSPAALEKLRRAVIEASKQCGRNQLLEVAPPQPLAAFVTGESTPLRLLAHPGGMPLVAVSPGEAIELSSGAASGQRGQLFLAVGPEGGFTPQEVASATAAGWVTVDLGSRILRIETAAIALVSAFSLR